MENIFYGVSIHPDCKMEFHGIKSIREENAPCLRARDYKDPLCAWFLNSNRGGYSLCIRKLTPKEYLRLMGLPDSAVDAIQSSGLSNSQQYRMAGNSIVVDTIACLFDKLFVHKDNDDAQMSLF